MPTTVGSLAVATAMQSMGIAAKTAGKVVTVDFVTKSVIAPYAAATGTTTSAVNAAIAAGTTISAGHIIIGAAALVTVGAIINHFISEHKELDTVETPVKVGNIYKLGNVRGQYFDSLQQLNEKLKEYNDTSTKESPAWNRRPRFGGTTIFPYDAFTSSAEFALLLQLTNEIHISTGRPNTPIYKEWDTHKMLKGYDSINYYDFQYREGNLRNPAYRLDAAGNYGEFPQNGTSEIVFVNTSSGVQMRFLTPLGVLFDGILSPCNIITTTAIPFTYADIVNIINRQQKKHPEHDYQLATVEPYGNIEFERRPDFQELPQLKPNEFLDLDTLAQTQTVPDPDPDQIADHINKETETGKDPYKPPSKVIETPTPVPPPPKPNIPDEPVTPPVLPSPVIGGGSLKMYNPSESDVQRVFDYMMSTDFTDAISKLFRDPIDYVVDLSMTPVDPPVSVTKPINIGGKDVAGTNSLVVDKQFTTYDLGSTQLDEVFKSAFDYAPSTTIDIFLPYIGVRQLNPDEVMNSTLKLSYNVDLLSGSCVAILQVVREGVASVMYQWEGNMNSHLPIRGITQNLGGLVSAVAGFATGNPVGMVAGGVSALMATKPQVRAGGQVSGTHGFLGVQTPYLIITRPNIETQDGHTKFNGQESGEVVSLSNTKGFVMVSEINLDSIPATSNELDELESILKGGVIL